MEHSIEGHEICGGNEVLGEVPMRHMKLPLARNGSLLRGDVGWVKAGLGGMQRLEVLRQSLDLSQAFQLEWVIVGGKSDVFIFEASL